MLGLSKNISAISVCIFLAACGGGGNTGTSNVSGASSSAGVTSSDSTNTPAGTASTPTSSSTGSGITANGSSPDIATRWAIKEIPPSSSSLGTYYQDLNDAGDAVSKYTIAFNSNALITSGVGIAYADGRVVNLGTMQWDTAYGIAINNSGQLAITGRKGIASPSGPAYKMGRSAICTNGSLTEIPTPTIAGIDPANVDVNATDLNNSGNAVGYSQYHDAAGATMYRAFVFANGSRTDISPPAGALSSRANAISDTDIITGDSIFPDGSTKAFVYRAGTTTNLGSLPGYASSTGSDVNNNGQIAGYVFNLSNSFAINMRPFIYADGVMKEIPLPVAGSSGKATGINSAGQVVGVFSANANLFPYAENSAFLYSGGKTIDLNQLPEVLAAGIKITSAEAINNNGQILVSDSSASVLKTYLLSPVQ